MRFLRKTTPLAVAAVVILMAAADASAQVANIGLNLFSPGARANAMGRAFIGVADDASAVITNPAGLVSLTRPQAYLEFKSTDFEGLFAGADTTRINSVSFFSVSFPFGTKGAVAASRHEFLNFREDFGTVNGASYAGSIAAGEAFRVGATVSLDYFSSSFDESATKLGLNVGALWRANEKISVGLVGVTGKKYIELKRVPARLGGGVGISPSSRALFTVDTIWIDSSDPDAGSTDVIETHFGGEFLVSEGSSRLFLRGGGYFTPKKTGNLAEFLRDAPDRAVSVGLGCAVQSNFQIDFAYLSTRDVVVSAAVRF